MLRPVTLLNLVLFLLLIVPAAGFAALHTKDEIPEFLTASEWSGEKQTKETLRGKTAIISFLSMNDPRSIEKAKALSAWQKKYALYGFQPVGIVTPEFPFEANGLEFFKNVEKHGINFPVALDGDSSLWKAYNNQERPSHFFVDTLNRIRQAPPLDADFLTLEKALLELLKEQDPFIEADLTVYEKPSMPLTETLNLGYRRLGAFGNTGRFRSDTVKKFTPPAEIRPGPFYLSGKWKFTRDYVQTEEGGVSLKLAWDGRPVYLLAGSKRDTPATSAVTVDGKPLTEKALKGAGIVTQGGKSFLFIQEFMLYEISKRLPQGEHTLEISFPSKNVELYRIIFLTEEISR